MTNILIFESGRSGYGGSFKCCYYVANNLKESGYFPYVIFLNPSIYKEKLSKNGIEAKIFHFNFLYRNLKKISGRFKRSIPRLARPVNYLLDLYFIIRIKRFISSRKIKLVHTNTHFFSDLLVYRAAASLKLPVICHLRSMPSRCLTPSEKRLAEYKNSIFIAISRSVLKEWAMAGIPESKLKLIYDAQPQIKNSSYYKKDPEGIGPLIRLLYAGRLKKRKGVDILIKALAILKNKNWNLSIVGDGVEMPGLRELVKKNGLQKKITFYGFQEHVENFYRSHDILILPSLKEEFGLVLLEAMQFGLAVIGSGSGGIPEIIEDGIDGLLFESGNSNSLSTVIEYAINNPEIRNRIGSRGKKKVKRLFPEDGFKKNLVRTYKEMLNA
jgi:glycosyltransferase involved in cell wall biosynthesis